MAEVAYNNQHGTLGTALNDTDTTSTIEFGFVPKFATLGGGDYVTICLFNTDLTNFEIAHLTTYTAGDSSGTITRAAEDSTNWPKVSHAAGTVWSCDPTVASFAGGGGGGGVASFNTRTGAVTLTKADVTGTGLTYSDVGADQSGAAATAQSNAESFATSAVATETSRAETAEALLAPKASPALTGAPTAPTATALTDNTQLATTAYADTAVGVETTRAEAAEVLKAPLASPALTGTPTAPTKSALTNNTDIATTAYADAAVGVETTRAEAAETLLAPKASPALTGTPTAPTASPGTNTTQVATTAFVKTAGDDWFNVKAYGAKGDGTTDDTTSILAAVTAAQAAGSGSTVYLPVGIYRTSAPIVIQTTGISIVGDKGCTQSGNDAGLNIGTVIKPLSTWADPTWHSYADGGLTGLSIDAVIMLIEQNPGGSVAYTTGVTLRDFWIDGSALPTTGTYTAVNGISTYGKVSAFEFRNVGINKPTSCGVLLATDGTSLRPQGIHFNTMVVQYAAKHGFYGYFQDSSIINCHAQNCGVGVGGNGPVSGWVASSSTPSSGDGFVTSGPNNRFVGCRADLSMNGFTHIATDPVAGYSDSTVFVGCSTQGNNYNGFQALNLSASGSTTPTLPVILDGCSFDGDGTGATTFSGWVASDGPGGSTYGGIFVLGQNIVHVNNCNTILWTVNMKSTQVSCPSVGVRVANTYPGLAHVRVVGGLFNYDTAGQAFSGIANAAEFYVSPATVISTTFQPVAPVSAYTQADVGTDYVDSGSVNLGFCGPPTAMVQAAGTLTVTAPNSLLANQVVTFSGLSGGGASTLNGAYWTVASANATSFTITTATAAATTFTGSQCLTLLFITGTLGVGKWMVTGTITFTGGTAANTACHWAVVPGTAGIGSTPRGGIWRTPTATAGDNGTTVPFSGLYTVTSAGTLQLLVSANAAIAATTILAQDSAISSAPAQVTYMDCVRVG